MKNEELRTSDSLTEIKASLIEEFHDPEYREVYTDEFLNSKIATQIKVLREQRKWTQEELADRAEMKQERVAVLENVNYESWTLSVLRRFAKAFDLRLDVEFKEFGSFFEDFANFGRESLERDSFDEDRVFQNHDVISRRERFQVVPGKDKNSVGENKSRQDTSGLEADPVVNRIKRKLKR
jgi:transcriptional regulator with XRE-family HTH domain